MENERIINGKRCRYYSGLWIADTGDYVERVDDDGGSYKRCTIYPSANVGACLEELFYEESFDEVIAELFGPPYPPNQRYGKRYSLIHKDGNKMNCDYRNLEWIDVDLLPQEPYHSYNSCSPKEYVRYYQWVYEVYPSGVIKQDGVVLPHYDFDLWLCKETNISVLEIHIDASGYVVPVDEFMSLAGYVQGDKYSLQKPAILHRDGDYKNFKSENLEWVEETDSRYVDYMLQKTQAQEARLKELIKQNLLPPAPFTPPSFSSHGEASDRGENPFKPI